MFGPFKKMRGSTCLKCSNQLPATPTPDGLCPECGAGAVEDHHGAEQVARMRIRHLEAENELLRGQVEKVTTEASEAFESFRRELTSLHRHLSDLAESNTELEEVSAKFYTEAKDARAAELALWGQAHA